MMSQTPKISLPSFTNKMNVAIIGASGGVGAALLTHLQAMDNVAQIFAFSRTAGPSDHPKTNVAKLDFENEDTIATAAKVIKDHGPLDLVIIASGILHDENTAPPLNPEKSLRDIDPQNFARIFATNTTGPALVAKHFLPLMRRDEKTLFAALSARVGSIEDNRLGGWYAYRASKAALNMVLKNAAIEMGRRHPKMVIAGLHPGTVDTALSGPFKGKISAEKLFTPEFSAACLLNVIDDLTANGSGKTFAWDGQEIPY